MSKNIAVRLGINIAKARKASKKTQAEVAEQIGIDTVSLSRIERGNVSASVATLEKIANALEISLSKLFDGVSTNTSTLAEDMADLLETLSEKDRIFLLEQIRIWVKRLSKDQKS